MAKDPKRWKEILDQIDQNRCTGGFMHGVIEGMQRYLPNMVFDKQTIESICAVVGKKKGKSAEINCAHIVGHIVMVENAGSIPNSLILCDSLKKFLQYECASGVFMENETRKDLSAHQLMQEIPWNTQNTAAQEAICRGYSGYKANACWREISHMYAHREHNVPEAVFQACRRASTEYQAQECYFHSLGIMVVNAQFDVRNMRNLCQPFEGNRRPYDRCIHVVINNLLMSSISFVPKAVLFCQALPKTEVMGCLQSLGRQLQQVSPSSLERVCQLFPIAYRDSC